MPVVPLTTVLPVELTDADIRAATDAALTPGRSNA